MFGRYNLLCNSCNWEFVGFAVPGTVPEYVRKRQKQTQRNEQINFSATANEEISVAETSELSEAIGLNDLSNHNTVGSINNLYGSAQEVLLKPGLQSNINENLILKVTALVESRNEIEQNSDKFLNFSQSDEVLSEVENESEHERTISDNELRQRVKKKKRVRIKKSK